LLALDPGELQRIEQDFREIPMKPADVPFLSEFDREIPLPGPDLAEFDR
jgi:hypothetical protein